MPTNAIFCVKLLLRAKSLVDFTELKLKKIKIKMFVQLKSTSSFCIWFSSAQVAAELMQRKPKQQPFQGASCKFNYLDCC